MISTFSFGMTVSDTLPEDYGKYNIPTLERIYKNSDFNVHYMDIFEGNVFVIGENLTQKIS
ncbi:MAG: hypothetical protein R2883_01060 [Caldisericia bacterium]